MTFTLPTVNNNHELARGSDPRWLADINSPSNTGTKAAGNLPITQVAKEFDNNSAGSTKGYAGEFQASQVSWDVSTNTKVMLWHSQHNAPNRIQTDSVANGGARVRIYSGTGTPPADYKEFYIGGSDTPYSECIKGQVPFVIDLNDVTHNNTVGTFDNTAVTSYAYLITRLNLAGSSTSWNYQAKLYVLDTIKTSASTPTFTGAANFQNAVDLIQGTDYTNKLGNWVRKIGSVIFLDMPFRIGDNATSTQFSDQGATIVSPVANDTTDPRNRLTTQAMRTYLNLRNNVADTALFTGTWIWGTRAAFDWSQADSAVVTFTSPTFNGMGTFTLGSSTTGVGTWDNVDTVVMADTGVNIDGSLFKNQNGNHALQLGGAMNIATMRFESYAAKHAILIDTAGSYTFDNVFFDESGTNEVENTSGGAVTITVTNGGTRPGVTNTGGGSTTTVIVNVTVRIEGLSESAAVKLVANETIGSITIGDVLLEALADSTGAVETTTFNYEAAFDPSGLDVIVRTRSSGLPGAAIQDNNGVFTDETTAANSTTTADMNLLPAVPVVNQDRYQFGHAEQFSQMHLDISTAGTGGFTLTWQYWNGATWAALSGVSDGTTSFSTTGQNTVSWTIPGDWATRTDNGQGPFYYVRAAYTAGSVTITPLGRKCSLDVTRYLPFVQNRIITSAGLTVVATWIKDTIATF